MNREVTEEFRFTLPNEDIVIVYREQKWGRWLSIVIDKDGNTRAVSPLS